MDKTIIAASIGFVVGGLGGVLATRSYFQKKYADIADTEIRDMREYTKRKVNDILEERRDDEAVKEIEKEGVEEDAIPSVYRNYVSSFDAEKEHPEDDIPSEPFEIFEEEYESGEEAYYEKKELFLYLGDQVLADETDDAVYADETIGEENLEKFLANDFEKVMYIRNPSTDVDYEVTKVSSSFKDIMAGDI